MVDHSPSDHNDKVESVPTLRQVTPFSHDSHCCHFDDHFGDEKPKHKHVDLFQPLAFDF